MLVLGRKDDPGDVRAMASALFGGSSLDSARIAEKLDKTSLLGSREHFA